MDAPTDAPTVAELGRISYWAGKVNIHRPFGGAWAWDPDCSSGSMIPVLTSCKKWFPTTTTVTQVTLTPKTTPLWQDAGCANVYVYCDELYQVDVGTHMQLAASIATGRDSSAGGFVTSRLAVSDSAHLAYAVRDSADVAVLNPQTATFAALGGFTGTPQAIESTASGDKMYVSVIHQFTTPGAPDMLDVLDTSNNMFQRAAYTFTSGTQSVVDMAIVTAP